MGNIEKLMAGMPSGMDAALITSPENRRYYTGFPSSAGTLVVTREQSFFIIDSRYFTSAKERVKTGEVILQDKLYGQLTGIIKKAGIKTMGIEAAETSVSEFAKLRERLEGVELISDNAVSGLAEAHRMSKSKEELDSTREAQRLTDETFAFICEYIEAGMTEREIAVEMEFYSKREGSEENAFPFIVAAGANSAVPHAVPGGYKVKSGDFIVMDFGCTVNGYRSDMTRTVSVGKPSGKQAEVYGVVLKAQLAALDAIKSGVKCSDIDKIARDIINNAGYEGMFGHGLGHGLGLNIHENPRFSPLCDDILPENCLMSVEPGIYIEGEFGVRIEDIIVAGNTGCEILTPSPKELIIL